MPRGLNEPVTWRCSALTRAGRRPGACRSPPGRSEPRSRSPASASGGRGPRRPRGPRGSVRAAPVDRASPQYRRRQRRIRRPRSGRRLCRKQLMGTCVFAQSMRASEGAGDDGHDHDRARPTAVRRGRPGPRRPQAAVRPRVARRGRALRQRPVGPGRLPGPEHEPAPRGAPQRRARRRPGARATPSSTASRTRGSSRPTDSSRRSPARATGPAEREKGSGPDGRDQGRDRRDLRGDGPQERQARRRRLLGHLVRAVQDGRPRDGEARREVRRHRSTSSRSTSTPTPACPGRSTS